MVVSFLNGIETSLTTLTKTFSGGNTAAGVWIQDGRSVNHAIEELQTYLLGTLLKISLTHSSKVSSFSVGAQGEQREVSSRNYLLYPSIVIYC